MVIVDRFWRAYLDLASVDALIEGIRVRGALLIHAMDDNLFDLASETSASNSSSSEAVAPDDASIEKGPGPRQIAVLRRLASAADGLLVSTQALADRLVDLNPHIEVVPNAIDERLLDPSQVDSEMPTAPAPDERLTIGYMGTFTHDADMAMILPALQSIAADYPDRLRFQILGVLGRPSSHRSLEGAALGGYQPRCRSELYPRFLPFFTQD